LRYPSGQIVLRAGLFAIRRKHLVSTLLCKHIRGQGRTHGKPMMKLRNRIVISLAALLAFGVVSVAIALSYEAPCGAAPPLAEGADLMKAIVHRCYGPADTLRLEEVEKPVPAADQILVKVHAAAVNPLEWHQMTGRPYIMRLAAGIGTPKSARLGVDFAGTVEAVGQDVTRFKVGDAVFGGTGGALAEYVTVRASGSVVHKPAELTFEQAATIAVAGITALQGLRDQGGIQSGENVLINGASGGVGTFAVQIAKAFGAEVTGVCSTRNLELVKSLGADHVIDYTQESFTEQEVRYDLILDNVGNHSLLDTTQALQPGGTLVIVSGPKDDRWLGPLSRWLKAGMLTPFVDEELARFVADLNAEDLQMLGELASAGKLVPVIDRRYTLSEVPEAIRYIETRHARGKVVIAIE
jgi:NADPH:quinone reductase-like Zn-dependent oxidoreductase